MRKCEDCRYCHDTGLPLDHPDKSIHECRKKAPINGTGPMCHAWWPNVYLIDWCGEFEARDMT